MVHSKNNPESLSMEMCQILLSAAPPHRRALPDIRRYTIAVYDSDTRACVFRGVVELLRRRGFLRRVGDAFQATAKGLAFVARC